MSTRQDLNNLLSRKKTWMSLYDRCAECLNYIDEEFGGKKDSTGDVYFRLRNMYTGLSGGGFWQGPDADSFRRRLDEISTAVRESEDTLRQAIVKIQKKAETKTAECNQQIRVCYEQMDEEGKLSLLGDAIWDTICDLVS